MEAKKTENTGLPGWLLALAFVGIGVLLTLWLSAGVPGWRLLVNGIGSLALVVLLAVLAVNKRYPKAYTPVLLAFTALAWAGAWWLLQTLVRRCCIITIWRSFLSLALSPATRPFSR